MRDHTRLRVFELADSLAVAVYEASATFPRSELYGLRSQIRRAAVSVAANIVEGCARTSQAEYVRFLQISYGSARELQYELDLCRRLGFLTPQAASRLQSLCTSTAKSLNALLRSLSPHV